MQDDKALHALRVCAKVNKRPPPHGFHAFLNAANTAWGSSSTSFFPNLTSSHFSKSFQNPSCSSNLTASSSTGGGDATGGGAAGAPPAINMAVIVASSPSANPSSDTVLTSDKGFPFKSSFSLDGSTPPGREAAYFAFSVATVVESDVPDRVSGVSAGLGRRGLSVRVTMRELC